MIATLAGEELETCPECGFNPLCVIAAAPAAEWSLLGHSFVLGDITSTPAPLRISPGGLGVVKPF